MAQTVSHNTADLRRLNRNRVFRHLLFEAPEGIQKQDLARALGMSLPTLTQNLTELFTQGLVNGDSVGASSGGRPPRILRVNGDARYAVGVEVTGSHIRLVALDLTAKVLEFQTVKRSFTADEAYALALAATVEDFLDRAGLDRKRLLGVGVTVPGIVSADGAVIQLAPTLGVRDVDCRALLDHIPYPVHPVNDANAGGYAECWGKTGTASMAYLSLGRGVGGAILVAGQAYLGQDGRSGEFGHSCIHPDGLPCACGRTGCLEAYCSTARLSDELGLTLEEFFAQLKEGRHAQHWERYLDDLTLGIRNIHVALDCPIVLGGKLSSFLPEYLPQLERRLGQSDPAYAGAPYISVCRHHDRANSMGAALWFVERFVGEV